MNQAIPLADHVPLLDERQGLVHAGDGLVIEQQQEEALVR